MKGEVPMQEKFLEWLTAEAKTRGLQSDRMICKVSGLSPSVISKARLGYQPIGWDACTRIAEAFNIPQHVVLVRAGLMDPPKEDWDNEAEEMVSLFTQLSKRDRKLILSLAKHMKERE
jgi:hypothetical protein